MSNTNASEPTQNTTTKPEAATGCCGGPAPTDSGACCALDAQVKGAGGAGCGCGAKPAAAPKQGCC